MPPIDFLAEFIKNPVSADTPQAQVARMTKDVNIGIVDAARIDAKQNIVNSLVEATTKTEGLVKGQTPLRIPKGGEKWKTIQGVPVDTKANKPKDRANFFFVDPERVNEVIANQYKSYLKNPKKYGLSEDSTLEEMIKVFDQQNPKNKFNVLKELGINTGMKLKEIK